MLREYCPVIGASHAEGEASSSIAPWRLSASVQHHLIASSLLTSPDHASPHSRHHRPIFFFPFNSLFSLFIYPSYICSLFRFPILSEEHPSPTPPLHFFPSFPVFATSQSPVNFPDFLSLSLLLVMLQRSCGNSDITPVVLWPWPGGIISLGPEARCSSYLGKLGVLGSAQGLEGWTAGGLEASGGPTEATEVRAIQNLGSQLKGVGWKRIMLLEERKSSCFSVAYKGHSHAGRLSQTTTPSFSCHVITFSEFLCTATGIITFVLQHGDNIWCLFLINQAVSVHISRAVASDI